MKIDFSKLNEEYRDNPGGWAGGPSEETLGSKAEKPKRDCSTYALIDEIGVINQPTPVYLIDGIIPENSVCLLTGQKGSYKSFFGLDIALTMTHGLGSFHGHKARKGGAIYIAGEGAGGLGKRVKAWRKYHKLDMKTEPSPFWLIREPVRLLADEDINRLIRTIKQVERDRGCDFLTVWVDTVSRGLQGALEDEGNWGKVISNAERIKNEIGHGLSFIGIAHQGKDASRGTRGSSVADSNADCVLSLRCDDKDNRPDEVQLHITKLKDDEDGQRYHYVTSSLEWPDPVSGEMVDSVVLIKAEHETPEQKTAREAARNIRLGKPAIPPTPEVDRRVELLKKIFNVKAGDYTISALCDELGWKTRGRDRYDTIRNALPEGETKTGLDSKLKTKTVVRDINGSELVHIKE